MAERTSTEIELQIARLYADGYSGSKLADQFNLGLKTVFKIVRRTGGTVRDQGHRGSENRAWRGGRYDVGGYIVKWLSKDDPLITMAAHNGKNRYRVLEHRYNMAQHLGRPLSRHETVHHINGDRTDNRIENLQLRRKMHGPGIQLRCNNCGSHDLSPVPLAQE